MSVEHSDSVSRQLASFPNENPNPVLACDARGGYSYLNPAARQLMQAHDLDDPAALFGSNHMDRVARCLATRRVLAAVESEVGEAAYSWSYHPLRDADQVYLYGMEITHHRVLERELARGALVDELTGLANRVLLKDRLEVLLSKLRAAQGGSLAVAILDLDRFKNVNDSLGHEIGDALLQEVAGRVVACLRPGDTAGHLSGDEFAVIFEKADDLGEVLHVVGAIEQEIARPFDLDGHRVYASASVGIVIGGAEHNDASELLRDADTAMNRAKAKGGARFEIFDDTMRRQAVELLNLEVELREALDRQDFVVHYQPIVDTTSRRVLGFEALVRWFRRREELVYPGTFMPLAEETGLVLPLGDWVLEEACRQISEWRSNGTIGPDLHVSVNLSSKQLLRPGIVESIRRVLRGLGLESSALHVELTETTLIESPVTAGETMRKLRSGSIAMCIDDFGTGYCSLNYLNAFDFDVIKIDRSFVARIDHDRRHLEIVRAVVGLADRLGMDVVAEGVEREEQLATLRELGCRRAQGFLFSPALPPHQMERWLGRQAARGAS